MHKIILGGLFLYSVALGYGVADVERLGWLSETDEAHQVIQRVGNHLLIEFKKCSNTMPAPEILEAVLTVASYRMNTTLLDIKIHVFPNGGVTAIAFLAESHISIHTWPEYGYVAADIFSCGNSDDIKLGMYTLMNYFQPAEMNFAEVERGYEE